MIDHHTKTGRSILSVPRARIDCVADRVERAHSDLVVRFPGARCTALAEIGLDLLAGLRDELRLRRETGQMAQAVEAVRARLPGLSHLLAAAHDAVPEQLAPDMAPARTLLDEAARMAEAFGRPEATP